MFNITPRTPKHRMQHLMGQRLAWQAHKRGWKVNTLIVDEQCEDKGRIIAGFLNKVGVSHIEQVVGSKTTIKKMIEIKYDLLIIDLHIAGILGGSPKP